MLPVASASAGGASAGQSPQDSASASRPQPLPVLTLYRRSLALYQQDNVLNSAMSREWARAFERQSTARTPGIQRIAIDSTATNRVDLYWVEDTAIRRISDVGTVYRNHLQRLTSSSYWAIMSSSTLPVPVSTIAFINNTRLVRQLAAPPGPETQHTENILLID